MTISYKIYLSTCFYMISIFCHFLFINLLVERNACNKNPIFKAHHIPAAPKPKVIPNIYESGRRKTQILSIA